MESAEQCYRRLQSDRDHYLDRARVAARLTIPYLIPETNEPTAAHKESYAVPWNGIGARGCLNLASRMLLALLPPTQQFFRFSLDEAELAKQGVPPDQKSQVEEALSKVERLVLREIEASNDRVVFHEALLHLIVGGNALLYVSTEGLRVFHLNRYVCSRDPMGNPLKVVTCEELELGQLPKNVQEICYQEEDELKGIVDRDYKPDGKEKTVKLYTYIRWEENTVHWHQEVKGQIVPGTEGRSPKEISPWLPLRMTHVAGAPYGVGYVESAAIADLQTVEALCQAIAEGSLASSKVVLMSPLSNNEQIRAEDSAVPV